jgi:hypothetical protein
MDRSRVPGTLLALGLGLLVASPACISIDGGAVEVAWVVRRDDQTAADCGDSAPAMAHVRLRILPETDDGTDLCAAGTVHGCTFACDGQSGGGITPFAVPPGSYFFAIQPLTAEGTPLPPEAVAVPPPVLRSVTEGDLTDVGMWQIVILTPP